MQCWKLKVCQTSENDRKNVSTSEEQSPNQRSSEGNKYNRSKEVKTNNKVGAKDQ